MFTYSLSHSDTPHSTRLVLFSGFWISSGGLSLWYLQ